MVKVKVLAVDEKRKRIALTMRLSEEAPKATTGAKSGQGANRPNANRPNAPRSPARGSQDDRRSTPPINNAMAAAFSKLKK